MSDDTEVAQRFWSKVDSTGDCWLWLGAMRGDTGYGEFWFNCSSKQAHRMSYELTAHEPIPDNCLVLHRCNNRRCVNPSHLYLGDYKDNYRDMVNSGWKPVTGTKHGRAKLTPAQALEIRGLYATGSVTIRDLAKRYSVSFGAIRMVLQHITFREVI